MMLHLAFSAFACIWLSKFTLGCHNDSCASAGVSTSVVPKPPGISLYLYQYVLTANRRMRTHLFCGVIIRVLFWLILNILIEFN